MESLEWMGVRRPASSSVLLGLFSLFSITSQSTGSATTSATLAQILSVLDDNVRCGEEFEAHKLLAVPISYSRPNLIPLARLVSAHPHELRSPSILSENATIGIVNSRLNITTEGTYVLRYVCENEESGGRWLPFVLFRSGSRSSDQQVLTLPLESFDIDLCVISLCHTRCSASQHGGLRVLARDCCSLTHQPLCRVSDDRGRYMLIIVNGICAAVSLALIPLVCRARRSQHESRGWALMEIFLVGASLLYSILLLDWLTPPSFGCCAAVWLRQIGFATFYGSIVLKIYRNLEEYRVRKAQHVSVREEDMLKYLACLLALTVTGLLAWTAGAWGDSRMWKTAWPQCTPHAWSLLWHAYEALFLLYGGRLCYKARNSDWLERWQFTVAVCLEAIVTLVANLIRYSIRYSGHSDTIFTVTFVQLQLTVSVNIVIIIAPKFYLVTGESRGRTLALGGQPGRAHPSLAKLRDNILNGTIDFAEVPIVDMNPEDIRAELKRVYTQLRMYKLKNLYQDNPHISKRKGGGKRWSDKPTKAITAPRRISIPSGSSPNTLAAPPLASRRIEEDDKSSDLTVESAPHNVLLTTSCQLQLEPNSSVRV